MVSSRAARVIKVRRPECDEQPVSPSSWYRRPNQFTTLRAVIEVGVRPHVDDQVQLADLAAIVTDEVTEDAALRRHAERLVGFLEFAELARLDAVDALFNDHGFPPVEFAVRNYSRVVLPTQPARHERTRRKQAKKIRQRLGRMPDFCRDARSRIA